MLVVHNMKLVLKQSFHEFFYMKKHIGDSDDMDLLYRMQALSRETVCDSDEISIKCFLMFCL